MTAAADAAGEIVVQVDERRARDVRVVVLAPPAIRVVEVPTHITDDDVGVVEAGGEVLHGHQG